MTKTKSGFTIVELLIVIVVIGILAAITIVAYNGIQQRSRVATVQSELATIIKKAEMMKVDDTAGSYPLGSTLFKQLLIDSGTWITTRTADRTYAFCSSSTSFAIVSVNYTSTLVSGATAYYATPSGITTFVYNDATTGANGLEKVCNQVYPASTYRFWAHNLV